MDLTDLIARLSSEVPARDDVPSSEQYGNCVKEAVVDYGRRNPLQRITTISVVSGTADYTLPSDFLWTIRFETLAQYDDVLVTNAGIVPVGSDFEERVTIAAGTLTINPTPTCSQDRDLWYAVGYVLEDGEYADLTEADAGVLILLAQAKALMLQANKTAHDAWQYTIGDERVNKEKLAASLREQATALEARYREEVAKLGGGAHGVRATYSAAERARYL